MKNNIPSEVVEYVRSVMENYEYADNMRIMVAHGDSTEYDAARDNGCCGFVDYGEFRWKGVTYWYGFNYGH